MANIDARHGHLVGVRFSFVLVLVSGAVLANVVRAASGQTPCAFEVRTLHQAGAPVFLLAVGEIDASHPGLELLAVKADGTILQLDRGSPAWSVHPLPIGVEPTLMMHVRPTMNIGDVHAGFAGNEIVIETNNTVSVLEQPSPGQWQRQIVLDGDIFFGIVWGVRIGDIDPALPGQELFYITETAGDVSSGHVARPAGGRWTSQYVFDGEVGMDSAIGDSNPDSTGNEIVIVTEMGPAYEITPEPGNPMVWPRRTLWNDYANAGWTVRIADVLPGQPGNEIVYGTRYNDRVLLSHDSGAAHEMDVIFTGQAIEPTTMWDIAVGDVVPALSALEIVAVDDLGLAYLVQHDASGWSGQTLWHDAGGPLYAAVAADFLPQSPGQEIVIAGQSGAITLISRPAPIAGDVTCDGVVDVNDLLVVVGAWGPCPTPCPADLNHDGVVDVNDLLIVIGNWS